MNFFIFTIKNNKGKNFKKFQISSNNKIILCFEHYRTEMKY